MYEPPFLPFRIMKTHTQIIDKKRNHVTFFDAVLNHFEFLIFLFFHA